MTPYTARAFVPNQTMIWRLKRMVSMPMATSMKKVGNPVTAIFFNLQRSLSGRASRRVFFFLQKCDSMARKLMAEPMAVASPAP